RIRRSTPRGETMMILVAAALIAQAHVHGDAGTADGKDGSVPMSQLPHPLDGQAPTPQGALLVIHEWWGLNDWVKHQSDQLAGQGYLALAIDLYKGHVATDPKQAAALMQAKDEKWGDQVEEAGLEWLKQNVQGAKVATIGWCM